MAGNRPSGIFIDPEILKQVEVKHGGGSALYGNGGIGGTLAVTTMNANDFLKGTDLHLRQSGMAKERLRIRPIQPVGRRLWGFTP